MSEKRISRRIRRSLYGLAFGFWLLFPQCAQIVPPAGGPKDTKPPRAVRYMPDSAATNFSGKSIAIVFNEYIQLNDVQKQLLISPPLSVAPDVKAKGRILSIELKDSLRKNTTYTFNFGNSIRDFTEGNAIEDFQYIFSTGAYIDSLTLSGTVINAVNNNGDKGVLVMLYSTFLDSVPYKQLPVYFTKTTAGGKYRIQHIRAGSYKAFALKDINANYLYDAPEEWIGYSDSLVRITKKTSLDLKLFQEELPKQKLKKAYFAEHGHLVFCFAKPVKDSVKMNFFSQQPVENVALEYSKARDTLHYWFSEDVRDTFKVQIAEGSRVLDTIRLRPITKDQIKSAGRGNKWVLIPAVNVSKSLPFDFKKDMVLKFNHPINQVKPEGISLMQGAGKRISYSGTGLTGQPKRSFSFRYPLQPDTVYQLLVLPGTFTDIFGLANDSMKIDFKTQEEKYYGTLKLKLKLKSATKYILQLINEKGEIPDYENPDPGVFYYTHLSPGSYKLQLIYDSNGDGKWTTGDYLNGRKPEAVASYPGPITIRSNWDLEMEWSPSP